MAANTDSLELADRNLAHRRPQRRRSTGARCRACGRWCRTRAWSGRRCGCARARARSRARAATSRAWVESCPPDTPTRHPAGLRRQRHQPARQRGRLDQEDLAAAGVALGRVGGHERVWLAPPAQLLVECRSRRGRRSHRRTRRCGTGPARGCAHWHRTRSGAGDPGRPRPRSTSAVTELPRSAKRSVSPSSRPRSAISALPVPGQVGGRLAEAGGAVHLYRQVPRRRAAHEVLPVLRLGDGDVRGRQVAEHGGAGQRRQRARRTSAPRGLRRCRCAARSRADAAARSRTSVPKGISLPEQAHGGRARRRPPAGTSAARRTRGSSADTTWARPPRGWPR